MSFWHHYYTESLGGSLGESNWDIYDGEDLVVQPLDHVVLFPCFNRDHSEADLNSCRVLTKHGIQDAASTKMHIIFVIDNDHPEEPLLLKRGANLGSYFNAPHHLIKPEKCYVLTPPPPPETMSSELDSLSLEPGIDVSEILKNESYMFQSEQQQRDTTIL